MNSSKTGTDIFHELDGAAGESSLELVGALDADGLAAKALRPTASVIDSVPRHSVPLRSRIDVLESETDLEIHVKAALRLTDEAEVGVVHHHVKIGQLVLCAPTARAPRS